MSKRYLLLFLGVLVVLASNLIVYSIVTKLIQVFEDRRDLFLENENLVLLLSAIQDTETGQRGYIITGDESYLEPYNSGLTKTDQYLQKLKQNDLELLSLIQAKFDELKNSIQVRKEKGLAASQEIVKTGKGKEYMDRVRLWINQSIQKNHTNLDEKEREVYQKTLQAIWATLIGSIISIGLTSLYVYLIYKDALKRRTIEDQLKQVYHLQTAIFDSMSQYAITVNSEGLITSFNPGAEKLLGYSKEEVANHLSILDLYDTNLAARLAGGSKETIFAKFIASEKINSETATEWILKGKDGKLIPCLQTITSLQNPEDGRPIYLFIGTDMTERKNWEKHMQKALAAADAANIAKSKFLANISHDLRTPLNSIIGFSNILHKNKSQHLQEQELMYVEKVLNNGKYLLSLINEILDLSKIEAGIVEIKKAPVHLSDLILTIISQLEGKLIGKPLKLLTNVPDELEPLETDASKLTVLLNNLIGNAIKYTEKGIITVQVEANEEGNARRINVIDTGIGISEESLHKIFEPFFQVDSDFSRHYEGAGLGLAICAAISQLLGYEIRFSSQEKKGSIFSIIFQPDLEPVLKGEVVMPKAANAAIASQAYEENLLMNNFRHLTVLLIDNDVHFLARLGQQLQDLGCHVLVASTGEQGLELAKKNQVDLITLGIILSPMNGYEIIERLKADESLKQTPYAIISIVANEMRSKIPDALDYFTKQISYTDLIKLLKKVIIFQNNY